MAGINKHAPGCGCCGCSLCAHVVDCHGSAVSGATVTFVNGGTTLTGTTDGSGNACVTVAAGNWTVTASKTDYVTDYNVTVVTCPTGATSNLTLKECDTATTVTPLYITLGGSTVTLNKLFGVAEWSASTTLFGSGLDDVTPACGTFVAAKITITVRCVSGCYTVAISTSMKQDGGGTNRLLASGSGGGPCGLAQPASAAATITSFTASPITIAGTLSSTWTTPPAHSPYDNPPVTGSFSVTQ